MISSAAKMTLCILPTIQDGSDDDLLVSHPIDDRGAAIIGYRAEVAPKFRARRAAMRHIGDTVAAI